MQTRLESIEQLLHRILGLLEALQQQQQQQQQQQHQQQQQQHHTLQIV